MLEKVKETVAEALGADIDTITAETSFKEDLGADSWICLKWSCPRGHLRRGNPDRGSGNDGNCR